MGKRSPPLNHHQCRFQALTREFCLGNYSSSDSFTCLMAIRATCLTRVNGHGRRQNKPHLTDCFEESMQRGLEIQFPVGWWDGSVGKGAQPPSLTSWVWSAGPSWLIYHDWKGGESCFSCGPRVLWQLVMLCSLLGSWRTFQFWQNIKTLPKTTSKTSMHSNEQRSYMTKCEELAVPVSRYKLLPNTLP